MGKPIVELHACLAVPLILTTTFPLSASLPSLVDLPLALQAVISQLYIDKLKMQRLLVRTNRKGFTDQEAPPCLPFLARHCYGIIEAIGTRRQRFVRLVESSFPTLYVAATLRLTVCYCCRLLGV